MTSLSSVATDPARKVDRMRMKKKSRVDRADEEVFNLQQVIAEILSQDFLFPLKFLKKHFVHHVVI